MNETASLHPAAATNSLNPGQALLIPGNRLKIRTRIYKSIASGNLK